MKNSFKYFIVIIFSLFILVFILLFIMYSNYNRWQKNTDEYFANKEKINRIELLDSSKEYCNIKFNDEKVSIKFPDCNVLAYNGYTGNDSFLINNENEFYIFIDKFDDKYYFYKNKVVESSEIINTYVYSYDVKTESFSIINNNSIEELFQKQFDITPHSIVDLFMSGDKIYFNTKFYTDDGITHGLYYLNISDNNLSILIKPGDFEDFTLNPLKTKVYYIKDGNKIMEYSLLNNTKTIVFRNKNLIRFKFLNDFQIAINTSKQTYLYNTISGRTEKSDVEYYTLFPEVDSLN